MAHILSVSYDPTLLMTRELLLQQLGHTVTSVEGFARAFAACESGTRVDLLILGHSIPHDDKVAIVTKARHTCNCPIWHCFDRPSHHSRLLSAASTLQNRGHSCKAVGEMLQLHLAQRKIA